MGFVYFGISRNSGEMTIGATGDPEQRLRSYERASPGFRFYRTIQTHNHFACEKYLHRLFSSRRIFSDNAHSRYKADLEEIDQAIDDWTARGQQHLENVRAVEDLKRCRSGSQMLQPTHTLLAKARRLAEIQQQIHLLEHEKEHLEAEIKRSIGQACGVEGLATWKSREGLRFNSSRLQSENPELYESYRDPYVQRTFRLLYTPGN